jgi:hypothetical protein
LINEVVNEVDLGEFGADTMESRMEELRKQYVEKIREYEAKILDLENQVATLTMEKASSLNSALLHQNTLTFSLCKQSLVKILKCGLF